MYHPPAESNQIAQKTPRSLKPSDFIRVIEMQRNAIRELAAFSIVQANQHQMTHADRLNLLERNYSEITTSLEQLKKKQEAVLEEESLIRETLQEHEKQLDRLETRFYAVEKRIIIIDQFEERLRKLQYTMKQLNEKLSILPATREKLDSGTHSMTEINRKLSDLENLKQLITRLETNIALEQGLLNESLTKLQSELKQHPSLQDIQRVLEKLKESEVALTKTQMDSNSEHASQVQQTNETLTTQQMALVGVQARHASSTAIWGIWARRHAHRYSGEVLTQSGSWPSGSGVVVHWAGTARETTTGTSQMPTPF